MSNILNKYFKYLLFFCLSVMLHLFLSKLLIYYYGFHFREGEFFENIQLCFLASCFILTFLFIKKQKFLLCFFYAFVFFEEINWGTIYFSESIKAKFALEIPQLNGGTLSFHNMYRDIVGKFFAVILMLFLIYPPISEYLFPSLKKKNMIEIIGVKMRIYVASIFCATMLAMLDEVANDSKIYKTINNEYFELMLYMLFFLIVFKITWKRIKIKIGLVK